MNDTFKLFLRAGSHGAVVERRIHNLKVAGSNPEVGDIFSERYLEKRGEARVRERRGHWKIWRYMGGSIFF